MGPICRLYSRSVWEQPGRKWPVHAPHALHAHTLWCFEAGQLPRQKIQHTVAQSNWDSLEQHDCIINTLVVGVGIVNLNCADEFRQQQQQQQWLWSFLWRHSAAAKCADDVRCGARTLTVRWNNLPRLCALVCVHVPATTTCESVAVTLDYWGQFSVRPAGLAGNQTKQQAGVKEDLEAFQVKKRVRERDEKRSCLESRCVLITAVQRKVCWCQLRFQRREKKLFVGQHAVQYFEPLKVSGLKIQFCSIMKE